MKLINLFKLFGIIFSLLNRGQKKGFFTTQCYMLIMALAEMITMLFVWQLVRIVMNPNIIEQNHILNRIYQWWGLGNEQFIIALSCLFLLFLSLSTIISIQGLRKSTYFVHQLGATLSHQLHRYYLHQSWLYHTKHNSAYLIKQVLVEIDRFLIGVLMPIIQLNIKFFTSFALLFSLFLLSPWVVLFSIVFFSIFYSLSYALVQWRLHDNGKKISHGNQVKQQILHESFGGIKEVLLLNKQPFFMTNFSQACDSYGLVNASNGVISQLTRYVLEFIIIMVMIVVIIYTFFDSQRTENLIPLLSAYAVAVFKLLPAFQAMYGNITTIKGNKDVVELLKQDVLASRHCVDPSSLPLAEPLPLNKWLSVRNVSFKYPNAKDNALSNINLDISVNQSIAFVGHSGSGKSTLVDILLGLITNYDGQIMIDNIPLTDQHIRAWQKNIGYVAQDIFLIDGTIAENIAFGVTTEQIDQAKIKQVIEQAQLRDLVDTLADGVNTVVGERGINLSGGQKQRIAIARALYQNASILILDEATNALDGLTEKMIIETMKLFAHHKTIIMIAHRLNTIKHCDRLFLMAKGRIIDSGTYEELIEKNVDFKQMAQVS